MRTLFPVAGMLGRGGSPAERSRRRLQATGAALAALFLLAAVGVLALHGHLDQSLGPVSDPGTRGGTAFALCLLVLPVAAFLYQTGRLATADRERRLAALRLAGATPGQVRLLGMVETARSGMIGAVIGAVVFVPLWWGGRSLAGLSGLGMPPVRSVAAIALVIMVSAVSGLLAGRHVVATPLGVTRRSRQGRPHWYGLVVVALGAVFLTCASLSRIGLTIMPWRLTFLVGGALLLVGLMLSTTRLVWFSARVVGDRARTAETLLAARTLEADARPWGRTLAVVCLATIIGTITGILEEEILSQPDRLDPFWKTSFALVSAALLVGIAVTTVALLVHQAEHLLENGAVLAGLHASGTSEHELRRVLVRQALIAAVPPCVIAALTGLVSLLDSAPPQQAWRLLPLANGVLVGGLAVLGAVLAASVGSRRRLRHAIAPARLRTE